MDYAEAHDAFFTPRPEGAPAPRTDAWQTPARRLRDAAEPVAMICVWSAAGTARFAEHGLDFLTGYVLSRGCVLGAATGRVVAAAFGVFEPGLVGGLWDAAQAALPVEEMRTLAPTVAGQTLRDILCAAPDVAVVAEQLRTTLSDVDTTGRALAAGVASLPWPTDPYASLWQGCTLLRELRGDGHLAACVAAGITGLEANLLTEAWVGWEPMAYAGTRGWSPEVMRAAAAGLAAHGLVHEGALTEHGTELREGIEEATDRSMQPVIDALGPDLDTIVEALNTWGAALIAADAFPPDPYKRASG